MIVRSIAFKCNSDRAASQNWTQAGFFSKIPLKCPYSDVRIHLASAWSAMGPALMCPVDTFVRTTVLRTQIQKKRPAIAATKSVRPQRISRLRRVYSGLQNCYLYVYKRHFRAG